MEKFFDLANKTQGRDKLYRTAQYACKLIGWIYKQRDHDPDIIRKLSALESHASTTRKFLRLGKSLESVFAAQNTIHLLDPVLRYSLTCTHLDRAMFLLVDHYLWLGRVGLAKVDKKWELISSRFYLFSIILSVIRDLYAIQQTYLRLAHRWRTEDRSASRQHRDCFSMFCKSFYDSPEASIDLIRNLCDFPIPGAKLGCFPNHTGLVGLLGLTSSLIGLYQTAFPYTKLRP